MQQNGDNLPSSPARSFPTNYPSHSSETIAQLPLKVLVERLHHLPPLLSSVTTKAYSSAEFAFKIPAVGPVKLEDAYILRPMPYEQKKRKRSIRMDPVMGSVA